MGHGNNMQNNLLYHWERKATGWTGKATQLAALRDTNRSKSMTTNGHKPVKSHSNHVISTEVGCKPGKKSLNVGLVGEGIWMLEPGYGGLSKLRPSSATVETKPGCFFSFTVVNISRFISHQHTVAAHLPDGLTAAGVAMFPRRRKITKRRRCRWRTIRLESPRERLSLLRGISTRDSV